MRKTSLFQIFDHIAGCVSGPILIEKREGPAIRLFQEVLANKEITPGKYPEHFSLLKVGEQDEETAVISATLPPEVIIAGKDWVAQQEAQKMRGLLTGNPGGSPTTQPDH